MVHAKSCFLASRPYILGSMGPTYMKIGPSVQYKNLQLIFVMVQVARRHQKPPSYLKSIDWMKNGLRVVIFWASWPYILGPMCPTCMKIGPSM